MRMPVWHHSIRTPDAYVGVIGPVIFFRGKRHPFDVGEREVEEPLVALSMEGDITDSTQNQVMGASRFMPDLMFA